VTAIKRETRETTVRAEIQAASGGGGTIHTSVPFLDHMLVTFARYAGLDISVTARGDLRHHVIEDVAIALGAALRKYLPAKIARFGDRTIPMDDALVHVSLDLGGRSYYSGHLPSTMYDHWMRSFAEHAGATLHVRVLAGHDRHHVVEAAFKALGLAVRDAVVETDAPFSTKGDVSWSEC